MNANFSKKCETPLGYFPSKRGPAEMITRTDRSSFRFHRRDLQRTSDGAKIAEEFFRCDLRRGENVESQRRQTTHSKTVVQRRDVRFITIGVGCGVFHRWQPVERFGQCWKLVNGGNQRVTSETRRCWKGFALVHIGMTQSAKTRSHFENRLMKCTFEERRTKMDERENGSL